MDRAERDVRRMEGIICSMTPLERRKPELIKGHAQAPHRRRRRRAGAGGQPPAPTSSSRCRGMMKKMKGGGLMKMMSAWGMKLPGGPR